jgi:putative RecB family exonuclease
VADQEMVGQKKRHRRSVSQLHSYLDCPEAYYLERMVKPKLPARPASWLALGTAFHAAAAQWELDDRKSDPEALFFDLFDRHMEMLREEQPDLRMWMKPPRSTIENDFKNRRKAGQKMMANYIEDAENGEWEVCTLPMLDDQAAVETDFELQLGDVTVVGSIDLILWWPEKNVYTVRDLKTGNREKREYQLGVYTLAVKELFGLDVNFGEYWYAKDRGSSGFLSMGRYTRQYLTDIYATLDRAIDTRIFLPKPGAQCDMCSVFDYCRERGGMEIPSGE